MKLTLALVLFALALSLCNLMGRRSNTNTNGNSRSSGDIAESSPTSSPAEETERRATEAAPPASTGPRSAGSGINTNTSVPQLSSEAPPPPKKAFTPAPPPKTISGGVLNGRAISLPKPAYPAIARAARASGTVNVQVTVDESGNVISASPVSGHPLLRASAAAAARQAKFSPTIVGGQRVKVTGVIVYNFVEP